LLTPPDVFTQLLLAIPLVILYEVAIMYGKWRKRSLNLSLSVNHKRSFVSFDSSTPT
jgi:Sec-independent protein secretion pathway component TatC